jgi:hypothetical protein
MRYDSGQFGSFDGRDNRKELMNLFVRLGEHLPEQQARQRRAQFLQRLISRSTKGFADLPRAIEPCSAVEAYHLFVAITGCLHVPIDEAARLLERTVRDQP